MAQAAGLINTFVPSFLRSNSNASSPLANPTTVLGAGGAFPKPAPVGIDWHFAPRGGAGGTIVTRGAGDAVVKVSSAATSDRISADATRTAYAAGEEPD